MQDINLLQNKIKDREAQWQKNNTTANIVLFLVLLVILGGGGFFMYLNADSQTKIDGLNSDTVKIQTEIDSQQETLASAKAYQAQLKNLQLVLNNHVHWSQVIDELARVTFKQNQYISLQGSLTNDVHVEGSTSSYADMAKLLLGLSTSEAFEEVNLLSSSASTEENAGFNYSIDLIVSPNLYTTR